MKKFILLTTLVFTFSSIVFAGASGTLRYIADPAMCWKDGTVMAVTNSARGICNITGSIEPPTATAPYTDATDEVSINPGTPSNLGYNGLSYNATVSSHGGMMGGIEASAGADALALFRVWSSMSIVGSVYYVDGGTVSLSSSAPPSTNDSGTWNCDKYNPAYVITFSVTPHANGSLIEGTVTPGTIGSGNNQLVAADIEAVCDGQTSAVAGDGTFSISGVTGTNPCWVRVKSAQQERTGLPKSADHDVTPEAPAVPPTVLITDPNSGADYTTNAGAHTVDLDVEVNWAP